MNTSSQSFAQFILEQIARQPVEQRIALYRAYAVEARDPRIKNSCRQLADELEAVQRHHEQMVLDLLRRNA